MFHLCDPAVTDVPMKSTLEATNISHLVGTEATIYLLHNSASSLFTSVHNPGNGHFCEWEYSNPFKQSYLYRRLLFIQSADSCIHANIYICAVIHPGNILLWRAVCMKSFLAERAPSMKSWILVVVIQDLWRTPCRGRLLRVSSMII